MRAALGAVILVPFLCACGGDAADQTGDADTTAVAPTMGATPTAPAVPRDPCTLVSEDEVRTAAGVAGTGSRSTSGGAEVCTWTDASGKSAIVQIYPTPARYQQSRQAFESLYGGTAENVAGYGDEAFFIGGATSSIPTATVSARQGDTAVSVQVMGMNQPPAQLREQALALTRTVLSKL